MKKITGFLLIAMFPVILASCTPPQIRAFLDKLCDEYVEQIYKFGYQDIHVRTAKSPLHIGGDTLFVKVKLNQYFYDSVGKQGVLVRDKLTLLLRLTTASPQNTTGESVFAIDTSIYNVFEQYFKTSVLIGEQKDKYLFNCLPRKGFWELDVRFIAKKKGAYELYPALMELDMGATLPKGVCMLGDHLLGARLKLQAENNRIAEIYPLYIKDYKNHFGFYVE
ncbi:hypothetical protein [Persicitalea sp.]|uniref:hypothetical protein n=1 Tax=Persicitalea sp. TaxID=3100273 RepID=UPI003593B7F8